MKNVILVVAMSLIVAACKTTGVIPEEKRTIKEVEYVVRIPPAELTTLPERPKNIDVDSADQADAAGWTVAREDYILQLERMLIGIGKFFADEQKLLDEKAFEENARVRAESER